MTTPALPDENLQAAPARPPKGSLWRIVQVILAVVLVVFAAWYLWDQWRSASQAHVTFDVHWGWLAAASLLVLATYVFLIEVWRRVLAAFGRTISFADASRIWFVSNLGKYVPGKIWQVTTMAAMLKGVGVSMGIAAAASALITIANVAAGFALLLVVGLQALRTLGNRTFLAAAVFVAILATVLLLAPRLGRLLRRIAPRMWAREAPLDVPLRATIVSVAGCLVAWVFYGVAFRLLVQAVIGSAPGPWASYIAAYVLSYLVGYLVLLAPGGLGPREATLSTLLVTLSLATPPEAVVITVASRLWLTALEVIPGVVFLAARPKASGSGQGQHETA